MSESESSRESFEDLEGCENDKEVSEVAGVESEDSEGEGNYGELSENFEEEPQTSKEDSERDSGLEHSVQTAQPSGSASELFPDEVGHGSNTNLKRQINDVFDSGENNTTNSKILRQMDLRQFFGIPIENPENEPYNSEVNLETSTGRSIQEVSIQLLDPYKLRYYQIDTNSFLGSIQERGRAISKRIINVHEQNAREKSKNSAVIKDLDKYEKRPKEWEGENYIAVIYSLKKEITLAIEKVASNKTQGNISEAPGKKISRQYIIFYFREDVENRKVHIMTATTDKAFLVVWRYADRTFPFKIAEQVADPNKIIALVRHNLLGDGMKEELSGPSFLKLSMISKPYYLIDQLICKIKKDSFLSELFPSDSFSIKFTFSGILRGKTRIKSEHIPSFLDLLSKHAEGEATMDDNRETKDGPFKFLYFLQRVVFTFDDPYNALKDELDSLLAKAIFDQTRERQESISDENQEGEASTSDYIQEAQESIFDENQEKANFPFRLRHSCLPEFLSSNNFKIDFGSGNVVVIDPERTPPQIWDIVDIIKENDEQFFTRKILNGTLSFTDNNNGKYSGKIINLTEGKVHLDGKPYFKVRSKWYQIREESLYLLHQDFKTLLQRTLIPEGETGWLPLPWREKIIKKEETYNRLYSNVEYINKGYLVFDQVLPLGIEPCDILWYTKSTVYLYHVKKPFNRDTRVVCSQIFNATSLIRDALSAHESYNYLQKLYDICIAKKIGSKNSWFEKVKKEVSSFSVEEFLDIFRSRNLVFVYAYVRRPEVSLFHDVGKLYNVTCDDLGGGDTGERLLDVLQNSGYIDRDGRLLNKSFFTEKEHYLVKEDLKEILAVKEIDTVIKKLKLAKSLSDSTIAKVEVVHLAETLRSWGYEFKMCEIKSDPA